jgi:hypothetical protein
VAFDAILGSNKICGEVAQTELNDIPKFVAEFSVADDSLDIEIN